MHCAICDQLMDHPSWDSRRGTWKDCSNCQWEIQKIMDGYKKIEGHSLNLAPVGDDPDEWEDPDIENMESLDWDYFGENYDSEEGVIED